MIKKDKPINQYKPEDFMYLISSQTSLLKTRSRKFKVIYIGPLVVYKMKNKFQYILMDIEGRTLNDTFHFNRPKQASLRTITGPINTLADLKQILNLGIGINKKKYF